MSRGFLLRRAIMIFTASWILAAAFSSTAYAATEFGAQMPGMHMSQRMVARLGFGGNRGTVTEAALGAGTWEAANVQSQADTGTGQHRHRGGGRVRRRRSRCLCGLLDRDRLLPGSASEVTSA